MIFQKRRHGAGAVHLGGLEHLLRHAEQAREHRDRHEREAVVHDVQQHDRVEGPLVGEPVDRLVHEAERLERLVEDAAVGVEDPHPDVGAGDGGHRPGDHDGAGDDGAPERAERGQQQRDERAEGDGAGHGEHGEADGVRQHDRPEGRVGEDLDVVRRGRSSWARRDDLAQAVVLQREEERPGRAARAGAPRGRPAPARAAARAGRARAGSSRCRGRRPRAERIAPRASGGAWSVDGHELSYRS